MRRQYIFYWKGDVERPNGSFDFDKLIDLDKEARPKEQRYVFTIEEVAKLLGATIKEIRTLLDENFDKAKSLKKRRRRSNGKPYTVAKSKHACLNSIYEPEWYGKYIIVEIEHSAFMTTSLAGKRGTELMKRHPIFFVEKAADPKHLEYLNNLKATKNLEEILRLRRAQEPRPKGPSRGRAVVTW